MVRSPLVRSLVADIADDRRVRRFRLLKEALDGDCRSDGVESCEIAPPNVVKLIEMAAGYYDVCGPPSRPTKRDKIALIMQGR